MQKELKKPILTLPTWLYVIAWLFFVYLFLQILDFEASNSNNFFLNGLYFIDFGVHEASHLVCVFLPDIYVALAGSVGEITFTLLLLFAAFKGRSYFAGVFAGLWVMLSMNCVGRYMADARSQLLPLMGPGESVQHDWHFIFGQLGWLEMDKVIGGGLCNLGNVIGGLSLLFGLVLIVISIKNNFKNGKPPQ